MSESTQNRKDQNQKFLERATRACLELIELSLYLYLYYRGIYEEDFFRSVRRFSVIIKECVSEDIISYVNQALKSAEELMRTGQLKGIHCVISHSDGQEIERLCFEMKSPIDLEDKTADFFRQVRPHEMEKYYQIFLNKVQGEDDAKNVYAESSYHFTRTLMTFALLNDLPEQNSWHLEYKVTGNNFLKISETNGKSLVPAEPSNSDAAAMKPISSSCYSFINMDAFMRLSKL
ncbi:unnamed protein product [Oikopleura dioica]|uniref:HORMA domain-containing protein n=1 Tax=Oikopleura dioica TaxID=34765 RepID=E4X3I9_OIKDI|nr:unnamed protein product [Oikopleura dioica]